MASNQEVDGLYISKIAFDSWWSGTYVDRCTRLLVVEIEALIDFHWGELCSSVRGTQKSLNVDEQRPRYAYIESIANQPCTCTAYQLDGDDPTICHSCTARGELDFLSEGHTRALARLEEAK